MVLLGIQVADCHRTPVGTSCHLEGAIRTRFSVETEMPGNSETGRSTSLMPVANFLRWAVWGSGIALCAFLLLAGDLAGTLLALLSFSFCGFWVHRLARDFQQGKVLLPYGYIHRSGHRVAFWVFNCLYWILIPLLVAGTAGALLGL